MSEQRFKPNNAQSIESGTGASYAFTPIAILDEEKVHEMASLSRTTRWRMERRGDFPKRVRLSPGRVGWLKADIEAWISSRAA